MYSKRVGVGGGAGAQGRGTPWLGHCPGQECDHGGGGSHREIPRGGGAVNRWFHSLSFSLSLSSSLFVKDTHGPYTDKRGT
jgi:hypothetical protein